MSDEVSKVIIFGANGNCGLAMIDIALEQGLTVTAFVRNPSKLPKEIRDKIKIIVGDVTDKKAVEDALEGQDAVLSSLGRGWRINPTTVISEGCANIVSGMRKHGAKRIAVVSSGFNFDGKWVPFVIKGLINDHQRQIDFLRKQDDIEWFAMMAPFIQMKKEIGDYLVAKGKVPGISKTTNYEIADFMVKCIADKASMQHFNKGLIGISHGPSPVTGTKSIIAFTTAVSTMAFFTLYLVSPTWTQKYSDKAISVTYAVLNYAKSFLW